MSCPANTLLLAFDIGAKRHAYAWEHHDHRETGEIANDLTLLRAFLERLIARAGSVRVLVEATGIYYLDTAMLAQELGAQVSVINPKAGHNFAKALSQRNKTDRLDAAMLLEFLKRMPFTAWQAPARICWNCATTGATWFNSPMKAPRRAIACTRCPVPKRPRPI